MGEKSHDGSSVLHGTYETFTRWKNSELKAPLIEAKSVNTLIMMFCWKRLNEKVGKLLFRRDVESRLILAFCFEDDFVWNDNECQCALHVDNPLRFSLLQSLPDCLSTWRWIELLRCPILWWCIFLKVALWLRPIVSYIPPSLWIMQPLFASVKIMILTPRWIWRCIPFGQPNWNHNPHPHIHEVGAVACRHHISRRSDEYG